MFLDGTQDLSLYQGGMIDGSPAPIQTFRHSLTVIGQWYAQGGVRPINVMPQATILASPGINQAGIYSVEVYNTMNPGTATNHYTHAAYMRFMTCPSATPTNALAAYNTPTATAQVGSISNFSQTGNDSTNYNTVSDHRLKENVTPVENGLDYILPLRPRKFDWIDSKEESVGFIAHELYEDFPKRLNTMVTGEKDLVKTIVNLYKDGEILLDVTGQPITRELPIFTDAERLTAEGYTWSTIEEQPLYQSIDVIGLISPLVSSVQQLKNMIDEQEKQIETITYDIENLEGIEQ